ncbi:hypothetical protein ACB092_01G426800 [Castanea dentata]
MVTLNTSSGNVVGIKQLVLNIDKNFKSSYPDSASPTKPCIYKVPGHLRRVNAKAYTPTLISIGPFHHGNEKFKTMEALKLRYGETFREREKADMEKLVKTILYKKEKIRSCYAKTSNSSNFHSDDAYFVKMILVDAIFILELFLSWDKNQENGNPTDPMKAEPWMLSVVRLDLVLLENQLPFFVIKDLYKNDFNVQVMQPGNFNRKIKHFTDLLRTFYLPPYPTSSQPSTPSKSKRCNWFNWITLKLIKRNKAPANEPQRDKVRKLLYSATQLHEAGVKFEKSTSKSLLDLDFDTSDGVLKIPVLKLNDSAEVRIRNIMAYEQFDLGEKRFITDYLIILDFLINTPKDMDLLCDKEIVVNYLGDNKVATSVVNRLNTNVSWLGIDSKYSNICENLNSFGKTPRHRWIAILRHEYFNTPWRGAATIAAFILLLLTLIQSVCSIYQVV